MEELAKRCLKHYQSLNANKQQQIKEGMHDYSLITSMLKPSNEVTLHSRFLCSMLNPKGAHYQGNVFLKLVTFSWPDKRYVA